MLREQDTTRLPGQGSAARAARPRPAAWAAHPLQDGEPEPRPSQAWLSSYTASDAASRAAESTARFATPPCAEEAATKEKGCQSQNVLKIRTPSSQHFFHTHRNSAEGLNSQKRLKQDARKINI